MLDYTPVGCWSSKGRFGNFRCFPNPYHGCPGIDDDYSLDNFYPGQHARNRSGFDIVLGHCLLCLFVVLFLVKAERSLPSSWAKGEVGDGKYTPAGKGKVVASDDRMVKDLWYAYNKQLFLLVLLT